MLSIAHSGKSDILIKMWKSLYFWRCLTETPRGPGENLTKNYFDLGLGNNIVIKLWKQWWVQNKRPWWRLNYDDYDNLGADTRVRNQIMKVGELLQWVLSNARWTLRQSENPANKANPSQSVKRPTWIGRIFLLLDFWHSSWFELWQVCDKILLE